MYCIILVNFSDGFGVATYNLRKWFAEVSHLAWLRLPGSLELKVSSNTPSLTAFYIFKRYLWSVLKFSLSTHKSSEGTGSNFTTGIDTTSESILPRGPEKFVGPPVAPSSFLTKWRSGILSYIIYNVYYLQLI